MALVTYMRIKSTNLTNRKASESRLDQLVGHHAADAGKIGGEPWSGREAYLWKKEKQL